MTSGSSYPTIKEMTIEQWQAFWSYLMHDYSIFDFVGKHGHDNVAEHLEWKRQDYFEWRINYDSYIEPPQEMTRKQTSKYVSLSDGSCQTKISGKPKPIPPFYGDAVKRIIELNNTPMTEEEKQKIHNTIEWFNNYMERVIDKNNSSHTSTKEEES